ncbi:unnamed protein product [Adineta ricciae]|uniref:Uncharacterized protein n=1 Tax=Adineta ricciae TaxID=249248 RepID=A0A814DLT5_ADIRI|nr:unnamed protein product [Adineta ricciae]CAF0958862.1 unnamed protein product [Adineta ricciae]
MARQSPFMSSAQFTYPSGYQQRDVRYTGSSNVEPPMALNRRPSLLAGYHSHFGSPERAQIASYYPTLGAVSMGPHVDEHSKRSRYPTGTGSGGGSLSANSQLSPLSIEVKKEQQVYQPQTEAISPTPDDPKNDSHMRDSTIVRNAISKLESEIDITMKKLHRAKLSQSEIRSQADRSAAYEENDDQDDLLRTNGSQTLIEKILHENRRKAEDSQKLLNHLNNNMDLTMPLYQEPSDLESLRRSRIQYMNVMKNHLIEIFKKRYEMTQQQIQTKSDEYDKNYQKWQKSIEKEEKLVANKDATTYRETFEKTFPELRKTREDKEKKQTNATDSSTSEQQVSLNTNQTEQELELQEEKLRKSSIVPPIIYDECQRRHQYINHNTLIRRDAAEFYKERTKMPFWTPEEKQIFIEKFTQSPKNFGYISSFLENKTTEQCVQFYYMTKKTENYKNLLRKQTQTTRRRAKQNATTTTTTTVTSSTTIETTLVTKVTSSNTIVSSTSQQILGQSTIPRGEQDTERSADRMDNNEDRRETNTVDGNEDKRLNKNRCQLLSCTTEKLGKKKNRKNRLRAFPNKWNELTTENREAIRRALQIPANVQRCCTRCYEKLIIQVRQRQSTNLPNDGEEDDEDEESSKNRSTVTDEQNSKQDEEWTENEIDAFTKALHKFNDNWSQIAAYVQRSEQSCRAFYQKHRKTNGLVEDEQNIDEDTVSISGSEDRSRRLNQSRRRNEHNDEDNEDEPQKTIVNEDSNDSTHGMIIDEGDDHTSMNQEKKEKLTRPLPTTDLTTINSLVEREISKTLSETEKFLTINTNPNISPNKHQSSTTAANPTQPPPLVTLTKSHSPSAHSHSQQSFPIKGSIMRGTPISPSNKPISIDTSPNHSHVHSHPYPSPRNENSHPSAHMKSSKIIDQQHLYTPQQAAYMRHYSHQQGAPSNFSSSSSSSQYLSQQQHKSSTMGNQPPSSNTNKSMGIDTSNTDTYETLRADFVTSRYLTTTHSPNHERQTRHPSEQRSPSQSSTSSISNTHQLLPPPTAIHPTASNPSLQSSPSAHSQHTQQQQAALLAASQILASSGMHPQELLASGLLPYPHYYNSIPGASFYVDPRLMHDFTAAANSEQLKSLRTSRHPPYGSTHSPPEPSAYLSQSSKRHPHENSEHMRYPPSGEYSSSIWRTQNANNPQQMHPHLKSSASANELSRHPTRMPAGTDRDARSPDSYPHRLNPSRSAAENPAIHFQRIETRPHHKSSSHEKLNPPAHYSDLSSDSTSSAYHRPAPAVHKSHTNLHHPYTSTSSTRSSLGPPSQISPHHGSNYMLHPSPVGTISPHHHQAHYPQQRSASSIHHNESIRNSKEPISIQEFMKQNVNEFVASTNNDNKTLSNDLSTTDSSSSQLSRMPLPTTILTSGMKAVDTSDQPILIDGDDDAYLTRESSETNVEGSSKSHSNQDVNKSHVDSDQPERRRDSSIKKILSNQPLEKPEYVEINQKVQNSTVGASKVHSNSDINGLERTNSTGGRESTRSRGSITMRMLMGANGIYADGKAQPMIANEASSEQANKRAASPNNDKSHLEYLIRGELIRECPTLAKTDESAAIFQARRLSPTTQHAQRSSSSQHQSSKRMRTSPRDDSISNSEQHHSTHESPTNVRDPFLLQSHPKMTHHSSNQSSSAPTADRNWQSLVQQQYQQSYGTRSSRPSLVSSGSITLGNPISPSVRLSAEQSQYPPTANNQLVHPRYSYHMSKNEQQFSPPRQSSTSPHDHLSKGKFARRAQQTHSSSSDSPHESSLSINVDQPANVRNSPITPVPINQSSSTPPIATSPVSSSASPTTSISSNNPHSLKKRLISEYEFEQQQQQQHQQEQHNSPTAASLIVSASTPPPIVLTETKPSSEPVVTTDSTIPASNFENISDTETPKETTNERPDENESTT